MADKGPAALLIALGAKGKGGAAASPESDADDDPKAGGALAMREMRRAMDDGDDAGAFEALERAVALCGGYSEKG